jgi:SAM-dependent methyltransferase
MAVDILDLMRFYDSPLGQVVVRVVGRRIAEAWGETRGRRILGLGYAVPFLARTAECERMIALMPARQGVVHWPDPARSATAMADPTCLPLHEGSFDRVLVVHALEEEPEPLELLDEVARILAPEGRALFVCPNRRGLWARMDSTPFGHGQPFSRKQIRRMLEGTLLEATAWQEVLYVPPLPNAAMLRSAGAWEGLGRRLSLPFAGLHLVETTRRQHRLIPARSARRRAKRQPVLVPVPASRDRA